MARLIVAIALFCIGVGNLKSEKVNKIIAKIIEILQQSLLGSHLIISN